MKTILINDNNLAIYTKQNKSRFKQDASLSIYTSLPKPSYSRRVLSTPTSILFRLNVELESYFSPNHTILDSRRNDIKLGRFTDSSALTTFHICWFLSLVMLS